MNGIPQTFTFTLGQTVTSPTASAGGPYSGTINTPVIFDGGSTNPAGGALTYSWSFGDGAIGSGVNPSHAYSAAGIYYVTLEVSNSQGQTASASTTVTIATPTQQIQNIQNDLQNAVAAGQIAQSDANLLSADLNNIQFIFSGGGAGHSSSGGGSSWSSLWDAFKNMFNDLFNLFKSGKISLQFLWDFLNKLLTLFRALIGDPSAILELLKYLAQLLHSIGIINDSQYQQVSGALNIIGAALGLGDFSLANASVNNFTQSINNLSARGIIDAGVGAALSNAGSYVGSFVGSVATQVNNVNTIKQKLSALQSASAITNGVSQSIQSKLDNAVRALESGDISGALQQFGNAIDQIQKTTALSDADKSDLLSSLNSIVSAIKVF